MQVDPKDLVLKNMEIKLEQMLGRYVWDVPCLFHEQVISDLYIFYLHML